jgi:hypothetical protein
MKPKVVSTGELAQRIGQPQYRVDHIIRSRRIDPLLSAGGRHFYRESDVQRIKLELEAIDARKRPRRDATGDSDPTVTS